MRKSKNKSNDINCLKLGEEIIELYKREDKANAEEYPNLTRNMTSNPHFPKLINSLESKRKYYHTNSEKMVNHDKMLQVIKKRERAKKIRLTIIAGCCSIAAASILFFISLPINQIDTTEEIAPKSVVAERPMLILGNGNSIDLKTISSAEGYNIDTVNNIVNYKGCNENDTKSDIAQTVTYNTIVVPKMYTYDIILEDGTKVKLNANSELHYPTKFADDKREVELKGEGYFDVAKNEKPFIVKANMVNVKVYGTKFNVNMRSVGYIETTVAEGSVGVFAEGKQDKEVILKPNQMARTNIENGIGAIKETDSERYTAWISGFFRCETEQLTVLLEEISNWFNVKFKYNDNSINNIIVSASINVNKPIEETLKLIEIISDVKFIKNEDYGYTIEKKN